MRETQTTCSRCGDSAIGEDWVSLTPEDPLETFNREFQAFDLCPGCLDSFYVWLLYERLDEHDLEAFRAAEGLGEYAEE